MDPKSINLRLLEDDPLEVWGANTIEEFKQLELKKMKFKFHYGTYKKSFYMPTLYSK